jgi:plastocyanin
MYAMACRRGLHVILAVGAALLLIVWGVAGAFGVGGSVRAAGAAAVTIENFAFSPQTLQVAPGTTVVWTNKDSVAHTVTSDTGAWADSGNLATGATFSHTFSTPGTYRYHCAIHPNMTATLVVAAAGSTPGSGTGSGQMGMSAMGPMAKVAMRAFTGYYDGKPVHYLSTDTSSKAEAARDHINYAPSLAKSLAQTNAIYLIMNGKYAARGPVFASIPGDPGYSPLWQEVQVTWKDPAAAVALGKDDTITALAKAGKLTLKQTGVVLNCPIIIAMSGM